MSFEDTKVSVVVPVYNECKLIDRTIDSVLAQTITEIELIIVNDASIDNTKDVINKYRRIDSRIKIINHERNLGQFIGLKNGRDISVGEYQTIIGATDTIYPDYCEKLYQYAKKHDVDVLYCMLQRINIHGRIEKPQQYDKKRAKIDFKGRNSVLEAYFNGEIVDNDLGQMIRTSLWKKVSYKIPKLEIIKSTDTLYNLYVMKEASRVASFNEVLYTQHRNRGGVSLNREINHIIRKLYSLLLVRRQMRLDAENNKITEKIVYRIVGDHIINEARIPNEQKPFEKICVLLHNRDEEDLLIDLIGLLQDSISKNIETGDRTGLPWLDKLFNRLNF